MDYTFMYIHNDIKEIIHYVVINILKFKELKSYAPTNDRIFIKLWIPVKVTLQCPYFGLPMIQDEINITN